MMQHKRWVIAGILGALASGLWALAQPAALSHAAPVMLYAPRIVAAGRVVPAALPARDEQRAARRAMREGQILSERDIERQVLPQMKGMQYLGPEYDSAAMAYRLKFIRNGHVVFVDVDARTGQVRNRTPEF